MALLHRRPHLPTNTSARPLVRRRATSGETALGCVIGGLSMVRALGRSGIPVALVDEEPGSFADRSRYCREVVPTPSWVDAPDRAVDALLAWAQSKPEPPVVFYQGDHDLLALSRARHRLGSAVRVVLPPADLAEALVDKLGFADLAERTGLPVPRTRILHRGDQLPPADWEDFPCVLKPATRGHWFHSRLLTESSQDGQKAVRVESREHLRHLAPLLRDHGTEFVLQQEIPGGEQHIVSYHAYVRPSRQIAAEFTGRKVRTLPRRFGESTCVEITDDPRVAALGREVLDRLGFTGVVKVDLKEDPRDGRLYVLELNPRFNLWHHLGTVAGVSIPRLVYDDCTTPDRDALGAGAARARVGVRWVNPRPDLLAIREEHPAFGVSRLRWLGEVLASQVNEGFDVHDPRPGLTDLAHTVRRKACGLRARIATVRPAPTADQTADR